MGKTANTARVGLLIPSSNTVMEVDFYRRLPDDVTLHTARMLMEETTPEAEGVMLDEHTMPAARAVGTVAPDIVVFGCTSAGALRGNAYDQDLCARIASVTGAQVVSVIASVARAIARHGARRIGIITPYVDALNAKIKSSLEATGEVAVVGIFGLGIDENIAIASVEPEQIVEFARSKLSGLNVDCVFASCTNFRAMDALPLMREEFDVPIVTSNQATFDAVADLLVSADPQRRRRRPAAV